MTESYPEQWSNIKFSVKCVKSASERLALLKMVYGEHAMVYGEHAMKETRVYEKRG